MKKFFAMAALVFGIFVAQISQANAQDYYVGTYSDGTKGYFMSETWELVKGTRMSPKHMKCYVKVMEGNQILGYKTYHISAGAGWMYSTQKDPAPASWHSTDSSPIADKVKKHCLKMSIYGYTVDNP
ncbi:MAG: hypothetical protein J5809_08760 [Selenomonadaceae bacterium]|nr:hypothetical protein [Selenomonadaceae bacterium]